MTVIEAIGELRREGYIVTLQGEAVRLVHEGREAPDRLRVTPCLEALKRGKEEAHEALRIEEETRQERAALMHHDGGSTPDVAEMLSWCFAVCMLTPEMAKLCERTLPCPKYGTVK